ncbi:MAG: Phosphoglycolate phosphatase [Syntrophomonadaceae bacterium]|nr:Phosphoglycolate phosphatase [Bacillota bacterium]
MEKPATISFDIGNTLIEFNGSKGFCSYFCEKTGYSYSYLKPLFYEYFLVKNSTMKSAVENVCKIIAYKSPQEIVDCYVKPKLKLFDDVIPTLKKLKTMGIPIIAISNCTPWEAYGLDEVGLSQFIDKVFYSFMIGAAKPDPKIFRYVQSDIKTLPEKILHIGDTLEADVKGALMVGWSSILLDRKNRFLCSENDEYLIINNMSEIIDIIN